MSINSVKRLLSVTGFTALLTLMRMCSGFLIAKSIAIYAGPTGLAMLGQMQSFVGSLNGIVNSANGAGVVRYTSEYNDRGFNACSIWWRAAIQWSLINLIIIIIIVCFFSSEISLFLFENSNYRWLIIFSCCALPFSIVNTIITSVINGQQNYKRFIILGMISTVISTIVMITLIYNFNIKGALIAVALNSAIAGTVIFLASLRLPWFKFKYWWGNVTKDARKKIGGYLLMALTTAISVPLSLILVRNILISHVGWELTGQWQAVWKISEVYLTVITLSLSTYYLPKLSKLKVVKSLRNEINKTVLVIFPIALVLAYGIYIFRDLIITILFTNDFTEAKNLFVIQLVGDVIKILSWMYAYPMISRGNTKLFITTEILFSANFVFLTYVFVDFYGVSGANLAYLLNYLIYLLFSLFYIFKYIRD